MVPVRHVVGCILEDAGTACTARHGVHELLVHEDPALWLVDAFVQEVPRPPPKNAIRLLARSHAEEAEVVDACPQPA